MISNIDIFSPHCNYDVVKAFAWVNSDLDGVGSAVLLGNIFKNFEYRHCFFGNFEEQYRIWAKTGLDQYEKVFIVGMSLNQNLLKTLDDPRVVIVNDRLSGLKVWDSMLIEGECSSCTRLLYTKFKDRVAFTSDLKRFVLFVDDYNGYTLKYAETKYLNALYRRSGGNRFITFVKRFQNGFDGFTDKEVEIAESFFKELEKEVDSISIFEGVVKNYKVISTITLFSVNEIAAYLLEKYKSDVVIIMNPDTQSVSFRKSLNSEIDIVWMAEKLCDGGGGPHASGGKITPKFLEFTKTLKAI